MSLKGITCHRIRFHSPLFGRCSFNYSFIKENISSEFSIIEKINSSYMQKQIFKMYYDTNYVYPHLTKCNDRFSFASIRKEIVLILRKIFVYIHINMYLIRSSMHRSKNAYDRVIFIQKSSPFLHVFL